MDSLKSSVSSLSAGSTQSSRPYSPVTLENEELALVNELRLAVGDLLHKNYDTDYNLYRWIRNACKVHKLKPCTHKGQILSHATKSLRNHLQFRRLWRFDTEEPPSWTENKLYKHRLLPQGYLSNDVDTENRLLWFIEYRSLQYEHVLHAYNTSTQVRYHFLIYEQLLRAVNEQERRTGRMSGIHHVIDLTDFVVNPFMMLFLNNGSLAYFAQLVHYEHYPELVTLTQIVNCARWMMVPYKLIRSVMPADFGERFRLHDHNYYNELCSYMNEEQIPHYLGGTRRNCRTIEQASSLSMDLSYNIKTDPFAGHDLHTIVIHARHRKVVPVDVDNDADTLSWYFKSDGELLFGIFRPPERDEDVDSAHSYKRDADAAHMQWPWLRVGAKMVPERGEITDCRRGTYFFVFCNRSAWLTKRHVHLHIETSRKRYQIKHMLHH